MRIFHTIGRTLIRLSAKPLCSWAMGTYERQRNQPREGLSAQGRAVSVSSARTTQRFPSPRRASAIQIVRRLESWSWQGAAPSRRWSSWSRRRLIAVWSAQHTFVVAANSTHVKCHVSGSQISVAHQRDNPIPDQGIEVCQCLRDTASIRAVNNVQFCSNLLMRPRD